MIIIYTIVVFLATALGAVTGAGGGAIIKPVFDLIGIDNAATISVYSTIAVFSMCISSIYKHAKKGLKFELKILFTVSLGSVFGGIIGEYVFKIATQNIANNKIMLVQSVLLLFVLVAVTLFTNFHERLPKLKIKNLTVIFIIGLFVGALSIFIGIGGGPLNVIVLVGLMSFTTKQSTAYSIAMLFFAQIPKVLKIFFSASAYVYNPLVIPFIICSAVAGGIVGTRVNHNITERQVKRIYACMMSVLLVVCVINIFRNL